MPTGISHARAAHLSHLVTHLRSLFSVASNSDLRRARFALFPPVLNLANNRDSPVLPASAAGYPLCSRSGSALLRIKDKTILEKIHAIKNEREEMELSEAQKMELDKRLEKYEKGEIKFSSWEATKTSIRKRAKNAA